MLVTLVDEEDAEGKASALDAQGDRLALAFFEPMERLFAQVSPLNSCRQVESLRPPTGWINQAFCLLTSITIFEGQPKLQTL